MICQQHPTMIHTHTDEYLDTREQVNKAAGKEITDKSTCLLITPVEHNGKRYHRRVICGFRTIYFDSIPLKPAAILHNQQE
jgi:hypothetical protein